MKKGPVSMQLWGITDRGSVRKENQDAYASTMLDENSALGAVCDGMGGARAGSVASHLAIETFSAAIREGFHSNLNGEGITQLLSQAMEKANTTVYTRSMQAWDCRGMGTTIVAAVVHGEKIYVLNVGDSRCYLANPQTITRITRDHSLVEDLVERGDITPEEARRHPRRNLITRALGVDETVQPDIFQTEWQSGSFLLLCSDGLSNQVTDQEMFQEIMYGGEASDCCQRLLDIALSRGAPDNVTAVLMGL